MHSQPFIGLYASALLTQKLLSQGYQKTKLVATLKKFYGRHHDLVNPYNVAVSRIVSDGFASDAP